jgi:hypothetical protein
MSYTFLFVVLLLFSVQSNGSDKELSDENTDSDWSLDLSVGHQKQSFSSATARLSSLSINPSFSTGNWNFFVSLPWYKIEGDYYIDGYASRFATFCSRLNELTDIRKAQLIKLGKITTQQVKNCNAFQSRVEDLNEAKSGIGDVSGFVHYVYDLDDEGLWSATTGLGYKADTGDAELGLGTGTKDAIVELGVNLRTEKNFLGVLVGYTLNLTDQSVDEVYQSKNYAYVSIDASQSFTKWFSLGANWNMQQAYIEGEDATQFVTIYLDFSFFTDAALRLYTNRYKESEVAPDSEVGVELSYRF